MKSVDGVGITFVNLVAGTGFLNGIVNVTLSALTFTPNEETKKVDPDAVVVARIRMDEQCATNLRDALTSVLQSMADARMKATVDAHAAHSENGVDHKGTMN